MRRARSRQAVDELGLHGAVRDHAAGGGAALAGGAERAPEDAFDGQVEIGVVHDDDGVLAAHLERDALVQLRARRVATAMPVSVEPVNEISGTSGWLIDRVADFAAAADDEIDDAGRHAGLAQDLDEVERPSAACHAGRLEDDGIAGDERRQDLPRRDRHREVPRRDDAGRRRSACAPTCCQFVRQLGGVVWPYRRRPSPAM